MTTNKYDKNKKKYLGILIRTIVIKTKEKTWMMYNPRTVEISKLKENNTIMIPVTTTTTAYDKNNLKQQ